MIRSMGRLGKVYYYGYGAKYKYELVNNNEKLVKHVKEWEYLQYGKGGTFYLERCDQVSYCFK
jgi:hypothetical protein